MEQKFNIQESYIVKLKQSLDVELEQISNKDNKFFNLDIIMDLGRFSQKYSYDCSDCEANKKILATVVDNLHEKINTLEGRREISKQLDRVTTHLRKKHRLYIRRYVSSLYTLIFLLIGLLGGAVYGLLTGFYKIPLLVGGAVGLFVGSIAGGLKEANLKKNGRIYGKF